MTFSKQTNYQAVKQQQTIETDLAGYCERATGEHRRDENDYRFVEDSFSCLFEVPKKSNKKLKILEIFWRRNNISVSIMQISSALLPLVVLFACAFVSE